MVKKIFNKLLLQIALQIGWNWLMFQYFLKISAIFSISLKKLNLGFHLGGGRRGSRYHGIWPSLPQYFGKMDFLAWYFGNRIPLGIRDWAFKCAVFREIWFLRTVFWYWKKVLTIFKLASDLHFRTWYHRGGEGRGSNSFYFHIGGF